MQRIFFYYFEIRNGENPLLKGFSEQTPDLSPGEKYWYEIDKHLYFFTFDFSEDRNELYILNLQLPFPRKMIKNEQETKVQLRETLSIGICFSI